MCCFARRTLNIFLYFNRRVLSGSLEALYVISSWHLRTWQADVQVYYKMNFSWSRGIVPHTPIFNVLLAAFQWCFLLCKLIPSITRILAHIKNTSRNLLPCKNRNRLKTSLRGLLVWTRCPCSTHMISPTFCLALRHHVHTWVLSHKTFVLLHVMDSTLTLLRLLWICPVFLFLWLLPDF